MRLKRSFSKFFHAILLLVTVVLMVSPQSSKADTVSMSFTAEVIYFDDVFCMCLVGVDVGSLLTGTLVYDTNAIDSEPDPRFGHYLYDTPPTRMTMKVGALDFRTSVTNMDLFIVVRDSTQGQGSDVFFVYDSNVVEELLHLPAEIMWLWLADSTGTSIESDSLPPGIILDDWNEKQTVYISGDGFAIAAEISSVSVVEIPIVSRPGAIILIVSLLCLGAAMLIRR
jgi:hypothetical protein